MSVFFSALLQSLIGLLTSKKVLTGIATAVAGAIIKDPAVATQVVAVGTAVILGQGAADFGKAKKAAEPLFPEQTP